MGTNDPVGTLLQKLAKADVCMLTTTEDNGRIVSRPMAIQEVAEDHSLWFITRATTPKVQDASGGQQVNVSVAEKGFWASVTGTATVVHDVGRKRDYWNKMTEAFFGDASPEDEDIVLLRVDPDTGEYWDSPGVAATAVELIRAKIRGDEAHPGDNPTVQL